VNLPSPKKYQKHDGSEWAFVYVKRKKVHLGRWNSPEAKEIYRRVEEEWKTTQQAPVHWPNNTSPFVFFVWFVEEE